MSGKRGDLETEALYEIGKVLSLQADINRGFTSTLQLLRSYLQMENGTISLFDPVTGEVFIEAAPEMSDAERILGRLRPGEGIVGRTFQTGMPAVVPNIAEEPLFFDRTGRWTDLMSQRRALVAVPIREGRTTLGVLTVDRLLDEGPPTFDRDVRLLTVVAGMLGARVRLSQLENPHREERADEAPKLPSESDRFPAIIGVSPRMREVLDLVSRVAVSRATVCLRGESGTGKELVARAIHDLSPRAARPFVIVNCAALPESLVESELFGHDRGAFTGAVQGRVGRFELADGGTLFLDEVGDIPLASQAKLLRALQERQFERVGGRRTITVDVRIVAATNRDLEQAVSKGAFRLDLYHRLSVVTVQLPPLRERPEDIPVLAEHFVDAINEENGTQVELAPDAIDVLLSCRWSGNVRQLRNCLERAIVSCARSRLGASDLGDALAGDSMLERLDEQERRPPTSDELATVNDERERVHEALRRSGFVQAKAARLLGMTTRQLAYRIRKYGIELERF